MTLGVEGEASCEKPFIGLFGGGDCILVVLVVVREILEEMDSVSAVALVLPFLLKIPILGMWGRGDVWLREHPRSKRRNLRQYFQQAVCNRIRNIVTKAVTCDRRRSGKENRPSDVMAEQATAAARRSCLIRPSIRPSRLVGRGPRGQSQCKV